MEIRVTSVDYAPDDLYEQAPFTAKVLRKLPGPDRPDYWLAELAKPIRWASDGRASNITHLVLAARWVGGAIVSGMRNTPVNIAYVTDTSVLEDSQLDFKKCAYVAIGVADAL
jgi:hypothetical protein